MWFVYVFILQLQIFWFLWYVNIRFVSDSIIVADFIVIVNSIHVAINWLLLYANIWFIFVSSTILQLIFRELDFGPITLCPPLPKLVEVVGS